MAKKGGLGKGLDALFIDNTSDSGSAVSTVRISEIEPNKDQPRRVFDDSALQELADSIREHGVLQPIIVRPLAGGGYQIVAGERRWRASRLAGLVEIPAIVKEADDTLTMEMALIENLQREDLNILEEAQGYKALMELHGLTQEQVAKRVGKSRPVVANALRILNLPQWVQALVAQGSISPGHARVLAGVQDKATAETLANRIVSEGLSVREIERLSQSNKQTSTNTTGKKKESAWGENYYKEMEIALQNALGRRVKITTKSNGGTLELEFFSKEDLSDLVARLSEDTNN